MTDTTIFMSPERVITGIGSIDQAGELVLDLDGIKAFVVTDKIVAKLAAFKRMEDSLRAKNIKYFVYDQVDANPTDVQVEKGAKLYRSEQCNILIGVGGGSSMDSAKAIGILATNDAAILDFDIDAETDFTEVTSVSNPIPPLITIPTTAGTGAEVTPWAVVTNTRGNYKFFPGGRQVLPKAALVDPLMMESMPPMVTACTGIDALSHAIEAIVSPYAMSQTDAFAYSAIGHIMTHLGPAVANGSNLKAREGMAIAALEAGLSMNAWCGGVHALGHQLSTQSDMPHGMAMGIMMPALMRFNLIACPQKYAGIARAMGEKIEGLSVLEAAQKAPDAVQNFLCMLDLPRNLKQYGISKSIFPESAKLAVRDMDIQGNPRKLTIEQAEKLFYEAYEQ